MSEFGPSPEAEAQGISLAQEIASLRITARSDADYEAILQKTRELKELFGIGPAETKLSGEVEEQIEKAREILGSDVYGPEEVAKAYNSMVEIGTVPLIPFSQEELEKAKELNQMLVLRVNKVSDGTDLTMERIGEIFEDKTKDEGKIYYDTEWYQSEEFFNKDMPAAGWALVSKAEIPNSADKNYLLQTEELIKYLDKAFDGKPLPEEYANAVAEFNSQKEEIASLIGSDWKKAAEKLEKLQINQMLRQSPVEAIYDWILHFHNTDERLMSGMYTWTSRRASSGGLVRVGAFYSDGVGVYRGRPGSRIGVLGVSFSRSR